RTLSSSSPCWRASSATWPRPGRRSTPPPRSAPGRRGSGLLLAVHGAGPQEELREVLGVAAFDREIGAPRDAVVVGEQDREVPDLVAALAARGRPGQAD